jgi:ribonuclease-3
MNARVAAIEELERRIGHVFADRELLERALTHSSVGDGARQVRHNERLEFLGDRVLNRRHVQLVNSHACARAARRAGLPPALRLSAGARGARNSDSVLGDACEALIAALYIDAGLEAARAFFAQFWAEEFTSDTGDTRRMDPKTQLQEWAQGLGLPLPRYVVVAREGPPHQPVFTVEVAVDGFEAERGEAGSRQAAEKAAAQAMLLKREGSAQ